MHVNFHTLTALLPLLFPGAAPICLSETAVLPAG